MQNLIDCCNVWSNAIFDGSEENRDRFMDDVFKLTLKYCFEYVNKFSDSFCEVMKEELNA